MAQGTRYNEPFFWHNIKNVGWGNLVAMVELTHGLVSTAMVTTETADAGGDPADIGGGPGFDSPFSKTAGLFGQGWEPFTTIDCEDEGIVDADAFVVTPAHDETFVHDLSGYSTPSEAWSDSDPQINLHNAAADDAVGPGNWYSIKYIGPDTTIPHIGSPDGDPVPAGTTIMIWYWDEVVHFDDLMGSIFRHAFIVNFTKAKTVRVSVTDQLPRGTTTHWTVRVYSDNGNFVQHSDGLIVPVDSREPIRQFSGSAPDSHTGTLFNFNKDGFVT